MALNDVDASSREREPHGLRPYRASTADLGIWEVAPYFLLALGVVAVLSAPPNWAPTKVELNVAIALLLIVVGAAILARRRLGHPKSTSRQADAAVSPRAEDAD